MSSLERQYYYYITNTRQWIVYYTHIKASKTHVENSHDGAIYSAERVIAAIFEQVQENWKKTTLEHVNLYNDKVTIFLISRITVGSSNRK